MAKSKTGGSRAYLRGRIGSDVYSIGKNGKGKKQQVVRSLAESVANPQTQAQMVGRMIMSTIAQASSALRPIIDHSFDNVSGRQPNISEFTRLNYALIKTDVEAHPSASNVFGLNKYQEKGIKVGKYQISKGDLAAPTAVALDADLTKVEITLPQANVTVGALKAALEGLSVDGFITLVAIIAGSGVEYVRFKLDTDLSDTTTITAGNVASLFDTEGNVAGSVSLINNVISLATANSAHCDVIGFIVSDKLQGAWKHSTCVLQGAGSSYNYNSATALPTYPQGENFYLNGGDL